MQKILKYQGFLPKLKKLGFSGGEGGLPSGEVGDVDDGRRVLLKQPDSGELVGLQLPRRRHDERRRGAHIGDEESHRYRERSSKDEDGIKKRGARIRRGGGVRRSEEFNRRGFIVGLEAKF